MKTKKFVYPQLSKHDFGLIRVGGPGLANCMLITARALVLSKKYNYSFISPTWTKLSIGPYLRNEKDKRHYFSLFSNWGISGLNKLWLILFYKKYHEYDNLYQLKTGAVIKVTGLGNYFEDINSELFMIKDYFNTIIKKNNLFAVHSFDFSKTISVHIRLGDSPEKLRVPIEWYKSVIENLLEIIDSNYRFLLFSDGTDEELSSLLKLKNVKRYYFGNALADMIAISKTNLVIASDSTYSAFGAYLGQVPIIFHKRHFGNVLENTELEFILGTNSQVPENILKILNSN